VSSSLFICGLVDKDFNFWEEDMVSRLRQSEFDWDGECFRLGVFYSGSMMTAVPVAENKIIPD
jgi:hypothetical protein